MVFEKDLAYSNCVISTVLECIASKCSTLRVILSRFTSNENICKQKKEYDELHLLKQCDYLHTHGRTINACSLLFPHCLPEFTFSVDTFVEASDPLPMFLAGFGA